MSTHLRWPQYYSTIARLRQQLDGQAVNTIRTFDGIESRLGFLRYVLDLGSRNKVYLKNDVDSYSGLVDDLKSEVRQGQ
jgi:hypothetical protein